MRVENLIDRVGSELLDDMVERRNKEHYILINSFAIPWSNRFALVWQRLSDNHGNIVKGI